MATREIIEAAAGLPDGDSTRIDCPFCQADDPRTMSVTRVGLNALYHCFRATCGARGLALAGAAAAPGAGEMANVPKRDLPLTAALEYAAYEGEARRLFFWAQTEFPGTWPEFVARYRIRRLFDNPYSVVFTYYGLDGTERGAAVRTRYPSQVKRVRSFPNPDLPGVARYAALVIPGRRRRDQRLWLVEDYASAVRLHCAGENAVALLGTGVSDLLLKELAAEPWGSVVVALDPGAENAAVRAYGRLTSFTPSGILIAHLPDDIKNMAAVQFENWIAEWHTRGAT